MTAPKLAEGSGRGLLVATVLIVALSFAAGYWLGRPAPVIETAAPAEVQSDGSTIAERAPDPKVKPKHKIPKGGKLERVGQVVVQGETPPEIAACTAAKCPPVTVDASLVRLPDGSKRVVVSSPDGQVLKAVDVPVETAAPPAEPKQWAAGISIDPIHQTPGIWVERDLSRFRLGVEINQTRRAIGAPLGAEARMRLGVSF